MPKEKRFALIVGMEQSRWGGCAGANKDSNTMNDLVRQYVDSDHIVRLNDRQGTRAAVMNALNEQIAKVPEDGLFIFTYSGHGGQTNRSNYAVDDPDGKDEFLCLYDGYLLDNELWVIFNKCKGKILLCMDCCHSGTIYRLSPNGENEKNDETFEAIETPFFTKYANVRANSTKMLCISGCGEETVSWGDSVNGGCLTCSLRRAFDKCLTYSQWWNKCKEDSAFKRVKQIPICTTIAGFDMSATIFN